MGSTSGEPYDKVRIVCISDTHNDDCTASLPDGDILIHAGDMTDDGTIEELTAAYKWISALPHKTKIIIAGMILVDLFSSSSAHYKPLDFCQRQIQSLI